MTMIDILTSPRLFTSWWTKERADEVSIEDLTTMQLDYSEEVRKCYREFPQYKFKALPRASLEDALVEYIRLRPIRVRSELANKIKCTKENLEPLKQWVAAVTGSLNEDDVNIMAHWVWLVKRNSQKLPVVHHIMPIVTSSKQGGGKSTAVTKLIEPMQRLRLELKIPQVVDERSFTLFESYLIGFFDEMAGAEKVEISDFKRNVTSGTITYRPMRTNSMVSIQNLCSFIGASNNQVYEIIKDTTGIRRFFPIQALDILNQEAINKIDYDALWAGVDERRPRGYFENVKDIVAKKQDNMAMKDEVQLFLEDNNIVPSGDEAVMNGRKLYDAYLLHTRNAGIRFPLAAQTFYKKIQDMGLKGTKKRDERRVLTWFFAVNAEHALVVDMKRDA